MSAPLSSSKTLHLMAIWTRQKHTCDFMINCIGLEAMISREPERARQEMREVKVSDREPVTTTQPHLCPTWRKCTPGSEIKIITHTSIHTMSFFVCGAGALPAELECFYMRHVAFSFFKVQRLRLCFPESWIWNNLTAVFSQQSQKFKYIVHQNWTLWWDHCEIFQYTFFAIRCTQNVHSQSHNRIL